MRTGRAVGVDQGRPLLLALAEAGPQQSQERGGEAGLHDALLVGPMTPLSALLVLASLQNIPADLYEAARLDGCSACALFRQIALPSPGRASRSRSCRQ